MSGVEERALIFPLVSFSAESRGCSPFHEFRQGSRVISERLGCVASTLFGAVARVQSHPWPAYGQRVEGRTLLSVASPHRCQGLGRVVALALSFLPPLACSGKVNSLELAALSSARQRGEEGKC